MKGKIFTAQEVQSIISGNKTQFREVIKPQYILIDDSRHGFFKIQNGFLETYHRLGGVWHLTDKLKLPCQVGEKIFCREDCSVDSARSKFLDVVSEPAMNLNLQITEIRARRLQSIREKDAIAEGVPFSDEFKVDEFKVRYYRNFATAKIAFIHTFSGFGTLSELLAHFLGGMLLS